MTIDSRYVVAVDLEEYFVDKDTGQPLSGGQIFFYQDDNRVVPKSVFELTGAPPNYTYTALPNPITLSSVGTVSDNSGTNTPIYYFPYDVTGNIQLYYIVVTNSLGVVQFTRQAWPNTVAMVNPPGMTGTNITNVLSNPQFVDVSFLPATSITITIAGASTTTYNIAPDWTLVVTTSGAGSIQVQRTAIAGSAQYPGNPPYTLTITPGANVTAAVLRQRLLNNPDIFSPAAALAGGYLASSILCGPGTSVTMSYQPNGLGTQLLLTANNSAGGSFTEFDGTVQLTAAANATTADTGFVDILITLPVVGASTFSNVQVVGLQATGTVTYQQVPANRQRDQLFNYYNSLLQYKPISSYLTGWDFPLNPAQALGPTIAASAAGANTSIYVWDQTILFQSANNGAAVSRATSGGITITATNATQFAFVQYLPKEKARELLNSPLSSNVAAITAAVGGLVGTISLWYTTDANLPSTAANNSIVATLDANGKPATFNGTWTEVTRNGLGNAKFTAGNSATTNFNDYGFSGWDANGVAGVNTATWFAIVVGFAQLGAAGTITFDSISLVPGQIPTRPAPQTVGQVLRECQEYYEMSFNVGVVPVTAVGTASGMLAFPSTPYNRAGQPSYLACYVFFTTKKYAAPSAGNILFYNPLNADNQLVDLVTGSSWGGTAAQYPSKTGFSILWTSQPGDKNDGDATGVYWTADSRLGL